MMAEITTYSLDLGTTVLTEIMDSQRQISEHSYPHVYFVSSTHPICVHFMYDYIAS